ncbi:SM-20-like protein [Methylophaga frappieri]|uniref:SM-20-like protein n=1 Tax=Methylophaga frappieri (strain ATCC BAA-2434 / DSM 25690 / JAM7) TaxID=754477 RepID=I1YGI1_METFJ|nr:2OG-Fe(II) oxygenase [Methylophaga frappieri]AFJ02024.1 SM-20-like protein [Methylophaga frappieri]
MNAPLLVSPDLLDQVADQLAENGYCILPQLLPLPLNHDLYRRVARLDDHNALTRAGIGRDQQFQLNTTIRRDETRWLSDEHPIDQAYLAAMSSFRLALNERLFLGLFDYEAHFAHYGPGAFYKRHVDAFKGQSNRILTTVLYLNPFWPAEAGGQLAMYQPGTEKIIASVEPELGTFVVFLSDTFPHEVLPCRQDRYSIAGWFRCLDPLQAPSI